MNDLLHETFVPDSDKKSDSIDVPSEDEVLNNGDKKEETEKKDDIEKKDDDKKEPAPEEVENNMTVAE